MSPDQRGDDDPRVPGRDAVLAHPTSASGRLPTATPDVSLKPTGGDFERAAADSDDAVAATVAAWERARGGPALDWPTIGAAERGET